MPEKKPRLCEECGAEYPHDDQHVTCIAPTGLGPCGGKIKPAPEASK